MSFATAKRFPRTRNVAGIPSRDITCLATVKKRTPAVLFPSSRMKTENRRQTCQTAWQVNLYAANFSFSANLSKTSRNLCLSSWIFERCGRLLDSVWSNLQELREARLNITKLTPSPREERQKPQESLCVGKNGGTRQRAIMPDKRKVGSRLAKSWGRSTTTRDILQNYTLSSARRRAKRSNARITRA